MSYKHLPVMLNEVVEYLNLKKGGFYIDCTLGGAGYTMDIAKEIGDDGFLVAFDLDLMAIENANKLIEINGFKNVKIINDNFRNLELNIKKLSESLGKELKFDGIVMDLGMSSAQIDDMERGISFLEDRPLDMAFDKGRKVGNNLATEHIVNNWKIGQLERIFRLYGEEKFARNIAKHIVNYRKDNKITGTGQLVEIIKNAVPKKFQLKKIHPATKVFQALRIATNDEIGNLEAVLPQAVNLLKQGGRIVVVSFHSLEDRIVKRFFKEQSILCVCPKEAPVCVCDHKPSLKIITKKIIIPSEEETRMNQRARSAKMRVAEKC